MALYRIDVSDGTDTRTVYPDVGWRYTKSLNSVNEAELKFSGTGEQNRSLLVVGSIVTIYKDGVKAFVGLIDNTDYFAGGTVVFHASGLEVWLAKEAGSYSGSPWTSTASATIFAAIIAESTHLSAGTINAGFSTDYRLSTSQSLFNGISNLANKTNQDLSVDYTTDPVEISILDHAGSSTSVVILNEGKEITNLRKTIGYPRGNNIIVWGKGDGDNQIKGTASDATSIAAYGTITKNVIDRSIITTDEANVLAAAQLSINKDPPNIYDFDLTYPDYIDLSLGDVITLNALDQDVINTEVRIVGIETGDVNGREYITLQTTNPELKRTMATANKVMAQIRKEQIDNNTYMQGNTVTNEFGTGINADSTHGAKVGFYVPPEFETEAGSLNCIWFRVDYDIDPYNIQFGSATYTGSDPQVQNNSGDTGPSVTGTSAATTPTSTSGVSVWSGLYGLAATGSAKGYMESTVVGSPSLYTTRIQGLYQNTTGGAVDVQARVIFPSTNSSTGSDTSLANGSTRVYSDGESNSTLTGWFYALDVNNNASRTTVQCENIYTHTHGSHTHGDGSYAAADHSHPDGSYDINAADLDNISIGDSVDEAGSVNATGATIYLEFWNGSSWVAKYNRAFGSDTLKSNVDMTNSGVYPDSDGFWRIIVTPNSASADFVNAKVRLKYKIDN